MQVFVSFPDAGFPDVVFDVCLNNITEIHDDFLAAPKSLVSDAIQTAADEWGTDADFLELFFAESPDPPEQSAGLFITHIIGFEWRHHLLKIGEQHLSLDTPSFHDPHLALDAPST
eukprot:TRINITY_DN454_c0_g1_i8.p1 TRINITY_DN454_c0_g1~~TRINITY_DN454_c0_g1_i8.p1  ORF type:complete len:116 (-),score=18.98 TRINITY_DN454_c0_g1_i8:48-395(-)